MAFYVTQYSSLAPHCFRNEKGGYPGQVEGSGVELVELHINNLRPGFEGQGNTVARGDIRVGGDFK